jgi:hypothetical protein
MRCRKNEPHGERMQEQAPEAGLECEHAKEVREIRDGRLRARG